VYHVGGFDEALPRAEDLLCATVLLGKVDELELPFCDSDERRTGVGVPARIAAYINCKLRHDHVCRILRLDLKVVRMNTEGFERGTALDCTSETRARCCQDGPNRYSHCYNTQDGRHR
jgi:hypothetical protein